jgi:hypothetical protein
MGILNVQGLGVGIIVMLACINEPREQGGIVLV